MPANVSPVGGERDLTLDMVHQFVYCPRRFHLMYVEGRWADNEHTVEGRHVHRRVDRLDHVLPDAESDPPPEQEFQLTGGGDDPPEVSRSVSLSSEELGLVAKLDLVATDARPDDGGPPEAVPVETKKAKVPPTPERTYQTHRVQLMAQGLLLREAGYRCDHGVVYFAGSRVRVTVAFDEILEADTEAALWRTREAAAATKIPEPLRNSPKCNGCSLNAICLPDETLALQALREEGLAEGADPAEPDASDRGRLPDVRRLFPAREEAQPLYVQEHGAVVGKSYERLTVKKRGVQLGIARIRDVSQLVLAGNITLTAQALGVCSEAGIPILHLSGGHWFHAVTQGFGLRNAYDRAAQFRLAEDEGRCLAFARSIVADKAANQRTMIRRNAPSGRELDAALRDLDDLLPRIAEAESVATLLGLEGNAAKAYFSRFGSMLKPRGFSSEWDFGGRNRRPPRDPVNALLSFGYAMLAKECTVALAAEGLDPFWGFYHRPRHGRPSLALDVMEPLRPLVVDSAVLTAVNTAMVSGGDFVTAASGCVLKPGGRKAFIRAYEARLDQLVTHPLFDYRCSWRTIIKLQARLLSRWLRGDVPAYRNVVTR